MQFITDARKLTAPLMSLPPSNGDLRKWQTTLVFILLLLTTCLKVSVSMAGQSIALLPSPESMNPWSTPITPLPAIGLSKTRQPTVVLLCLAFNKSATWVTLSTHGTEWSTLIIPCYWQTQSTTQRITLDSRQPLSNLALTFLNCKL